MSSQNFEINSDFDWKVSHFSLFVFFFFLVSLGIECLGSCGESIWNFGFYGIWFFFHDMR